jgi:hypothetical protein
LFNDIAHTLFNILTQFTGVGSQHIAVSYGIASVFYLALISIAKSRYILFNDHREKTLIWGFSLGFGRELFMLGIVFLQTLQLTLTTQLQTILPLIEQLPLTLSMIVIASAYLRCFIDNSNLWLKFLKLGLTVSLAISSITAIWWLNLNPTQDHVYADFELSWASWALHINCAFWLLSAIIILLKYRQPDLMNSVLISFSLFALSALLPLVDIWIHHSASDTYTAIAKLCYLTAIFILVLICKRR